jgi:branched-chain amino acid transport system permease protein
VKKIYWAIGLAVLLAVFPLAAARGFSYYLYLANLIVIYMVGALGLNIVVGFAGQLSLGHAAFFAVGAYMSAYLSLVHGLSFWLAMPISCIAAGILGFLVGLPSLRLRGPYLALCTAGFGEVVILIINNTEVLGRSKGLDKIPKPLFPGLDFGNRTTWYFVLVLFVILMVYVSWRLVESHVGRALMAIKANETAARASGINTFYYKVLAFTASAVFAGLSGSLYAHYIGYVSPDTFTFSVSVAFLSMVVVGGLATQVGPLIGAALILALPDTLSFLSQYKMIFYGAIIVACMVFMPNGLVSVEAKLAAALLRKKG